MRHCDWLKRDHVTHTHDQTCLTQNNKTIEQYNKTISIVETNDVISDAIFGINNIVYTVRHERPFNAAVQSWRAFCLSRRFFF